MRKKRHSSLQKTKMHLEKTKPKWQHKDVNSDSLLNKWNLPPPSFDENLLPHQLFERFITNEELEQICDEYTRYTRQKGNHNFIMTKENLNRSWRLLLSLAMPVYPGKICSSKRAMIRTIVWCRPWCQEKNLKNAKDICIYVITIIWIKIINLPKSDLCSILLTNNAWKTTYLSNTSASLSRWLHVLENMEPSSIFMASPSNLAIKCGLWPSPWDTASNFVHMLEKIRLLRSMEILVLGWVPQLCAHLLKTLPLHPGSNYHAVMDSFFTCTKLFRYLQLKSIAATGTIRLCRMENPSVKDVKMMENEARGASDVAVYANTNMAAVR